MKKHILTIFIILLNVALLSAQTLSLDSCKALALQHNATMRNAAIDVQVARQVRMQVLTKYFPGVTAMAGGYKALHPLVEFDIDDIENAEARQWLHNLYAEYGAAMGLPNSITMAGDGLSVGATAVQPVFMGGQIINSNRLANLGIEAAELQQEITRDKLLRQVEESYWLVVSLNEKQNTLTLALELLDTLLRDVNTACEAGLLTRNDQLKVILKQHELQSNMLKLNNGITLAGMALCQMVGTEYTGQLLLTDTLDDTRQYYAPYNADSVVANRREYQLLHLNVRAEELKKQILIGKTLPHLMVGAGGSYGHLIMDRSRFNGVAFALLQIPITGWWESSHKIKQQNLVIQKAQNDCDDLTRKMVLETRLAYNNMSEAESRLDLMEITLRDAEANLETVTVNFQSGLVPVSEMLEAQTLYRQAKDQLTDARIDYRNKCAALDNLLHR